MPNKTSQEITFEDFYRKYYSQLAGYCLATSNINKADVEDIVQNAFIELWKHWDKFETHTEWGLLTWIKRAIQLITKSHFHKRTKVPVIIELYEWLDMEDSGSEQENSYQFDDNIVENDLYMKYLDEIKARLNSNQRQIFECMFVNHNSFKETTKLLNMKENTLKVSLKRLRAKLKNDILPQILNE